MINTEIEIKIKLDNPNFFSQWLKKSANFINTSKQTDFYFNPPGKSFIFIGPDGYKDADEWFRVRISNKGNEICYKKWHRDKKTRKSLYADEIESSIGNANQVLKILKRMGFKRISTIKKYRENWQYNDFIFSCDKVEKLGFFVEIEYRGEIDNPAKGRQKILRLLKKIGVKNFQIIKGGYPWMQWNPNKEHFEK